MPRGVPMRQGKYKTFSQEFKAEAVRLLEHSGRPAAELARELGVRRNQLYKWQERLRGEQAGAFPGRGRRRGVEQELAHLRRENARLRDERDILKKAAIYFARESPSGMASSASTPERFK